MAEHKFITRPFWDLNCAAFGLTPEHYGKSYKQRDSTGKHTGNVYTVVGLDTRKSQRKHPIIVRDQRGDLKSASAEVIDSNISSGKPAW
jgi:hypothetical protein